MATITILAGPDGPLTKITVPLGFGEQPERSFYACQDFMETVRTELPNWEVGKLNAPLPPRDQFDDILLKWNSGRAFRYDKMFKDLTPASDEVWEMKTADLRVFGWMHKPKVFIAVLLGYADWYKGRNPKCLYEDARKDVLKAREQLDLDEPKYCTGVFDALV